MDFPVKIDALELLIDILKDHEGELNNIVERLLEIVPDGKSCHLTTKISKWGNSRGVIIFKPILDQANLDIGDPVDIIIRKRTPSMR